MVECETNPLEQIRLPARFFAVAAGQARSQSRPKSRMVECETNPLEQIRLPARFFAVAAGQARVSQSYGQVAGVGQVKRGPKGAFWAVWQKMCVARSAQQCPISTVTIAKNNRLGSI